MSQIVIEQQREANEKSLRSVFVGNIPYEATDENLKDIFSQVGPVLSFRLVYDRDTGKPKGYGFCEYQDQETAKSAMRNLSGYELSGRSLRVDTATSDKSEELKSLGPTGKVVPEVSPYGAPCPPDNAPEAISQAVASLPPEQMFELMKQMKNCIQGNPDQAKKLLLQNPQLAYALLQALVVMRVLDPTVAQGMLHGVRPRPPNLNSGGPPARPPPPSHQQWPRTEDHNRRDQPSRSHQPRPHPPQEDHRRRNYDQRPVERTDRVVVPPPVQQQQQPVYEHVPPPPPVRQPSVPRQGSAPPAPEPPSEKADLIRQVMMLSDDQIASLPSEQRNTLMLFKEQYKSGMWREMNNMTRPRKITIFGQELAILGPNMVKEESLSNS